MFVLRYVCAFSLILSCNCRLNYCCGRVVDLCLLLSCLVYC